jgi:hypothetical protein
MSEDVVVDRVERVERPLASRVCRRCNRRLSASASVQNGMGRVCRLKAGVEPEQLKLGLFGEEETAMGGIDSVIEPMGEEDIASMERWNEREEEIDRLRARVAELEEGLRPFAEMILPLDAVQAAQYVWKRDIDRACHLLRREVEP